MIEMNRETLMMVATIVAIAGVIFLFKEMNKAKQDVESLKNFSAHLIQRLSAPEPKSPTDSETENEMSDETETPVEKVDE